MCGRVGKIKKTTRSPF